MTKTEINAAIVAEARAKIKDLWLQGKLDIFPVANAFTHRPLYWMDGNTALFKVLMWTINDLDADEISAELDDRISAARQYFGIWCFSTNR